MAIRLILVCKDGEAKESYLKEIKSDAVEVDIVSTYDDLREKVINTPYQGIMIDLATNIKASKEERATAERALHIFPTAQLQWERNTGTIRTMILGKTSNSSTLHDFINIECQSFAPRLIRFYPRKNINFNVLLSKGNVMGESPERTVALNVSKDGCFLFSCQDWSNVLHACFIINELQDKSPIVGSVRWTVGWGKIMAVPGIGLKFEHISQGQLQEIDEKFLQYGKTYET